MAKSPRLIPYAYLLSIVQEQSITRKGNALKINLSTPEDPSMHTKGNNMAKTPQQKRKQRSEPPKPVLISGLRRSRAKTEGNNPKDRYGLAKVPFSLIPPTAQVFMALGLKHGARKYGPFNWRVEPVQGRVYLEAAQRHLLLLLDGEDFDRDTGIHHGAFILSTIAIYLDAMVCNTLIDNRSLPGRTGDLVAFFNELPGQERSIEELREGFKKLIPSHFT